MNRRDAARGGDTIPALLLNRARRYPKVLALRGPEGQLTYAALADDALLVTRAAMSLGIRRGDRVALWAPNSARWVVTALGLLGAGATVVPISTRLTGTEAADILARSRSRVLFTVRGFLGNDYPRMLAEAGRALPNLTHTVLFGENISATRTSGSPDVGSDPAAQASESSGAGGNSAVRGAGPVGVWRSSPGIGVVLPWSAFLDSAPGTTLETALAQAKAVAPEDISDILFTSGTTGMPKGVLATHRQTLEVFASWADAVTLRHGDRYLLVNPFSHTFGYKAGIIACLLRAATMVPVARFDPDEVMDLIEREHITVLASPPTLFTDLLRRDHRAHDLSSLRLAGTGGTTIPTELVRRIRSDLGVPHVFTAYGQTESIGVITVCPPDAPAHLVAETVGKPIPDTEIRLIDRAGNPVPVGEPGEITVHGANVMHGYLDDPQATAEAIDPDGWLHTGDIGILDDAGYLRITDRLKDMFIVGGFNAYPAEIERTLLQHPGIRDVAVVGVPDERLGEVGRAVVVPTDPAATDAAELIAWARTRLAGYKVPREIVFTAALPRNAGGKVLKNQLR